MEGVHATLCTILSDAMEGGFLDHTPAWRTYHYTGKKKEKVIAGEATAQQLIAVLEEGNLKYETYFIPSSKPVAEPLQSWPHWFRSANRRAR